MYITPLMYFTSLAWILPSDVETCCRVSDKTDINCVDSICYFNSKILCDKLTEITTTWAMGVQRNITARSCIHCCSGNAGSVTYCVCVFVALGIQREMHVRHVAICGLSDCSIFFHIISQTARFSTNVIEYKMCVLIFYTTFVCNISRCKNNWARCDKK
jgi:hypothetical protein